MPNQFYHRAGVFVDVQNIYHSAKHLYSARVNFNELLKQAIGKRLLTRAFAYVVKSDTALGEDSFFEALKKAGLELRIKDLQVYPSGFKKADWDVGLVVDAIRTADSFDAAILVTGDGDFVPLVEYLKIGLGKQVEVVAFDKTTSSKLKEAADKFTAIDSLPKALMRIPKRPSRSSRSKNNK